MTRSELEKARIALMQAVNRSSDGDWQATNHSIQEAHGHLHRAGETNLADRVMVARGVGATSSSARTELREVAQLLESRDELQQSMAETDAATFQTREVSQ